MTAEPATVEPEVLAVILALAWELAMADGAVDAREEALFEQLGVVGGAA